MIESGIARKEPTERIDITEYELMTMSRDDLEALERADLLPDVQVCRSDGFDRTISYRYRAQVPCITSLTSEELS